MPVLVACPSCSRKLSVPDAAVGRTARCPGCRTQFPIPAPPPADAFDFGPEPPQPAAERTPRGKSPPGSRKPVVVGAVVVIVAGLVIAGVVLSAGPNKTAPGTGPVAQTGPRADGGTKPADPPAATASGGQGTAPPAATARKSPPVVPPVPPPVTQAPPVKSSPPPVSRPPEWVAAATRELEAVKQLTRPVEPRRPSYMAPAEYDQFKEDAAGFFRTQYPVENPGRFHEPELVVSINYDYVSLMPETHQAVQREGYTQLARRTDAEITTLANVVPAVRKLLDPKFRAAMRARLPWEERKKLFGEFAAATGVSGWTLLHPFDHLTGEEMRQAVAAARQAKESGLGSLAASERALILRAGAVEFFETLLKARK